MKSKLNPGILEEPIETYPCLGISKFHGQVLLFSERGTGVVLEPGTSANYVGFLRTKVDMSRYIRYHGSVTISN